MVKEIALIDCDSFFVSCEQLVNPKLLNRPVCVMSNNDGCVVARSKEAKKIGIKMGMPVFMAKKEFPGAIYLSGNMSLYGEISERVMKTLHEFSPVVEVYSIDEAFIDLTGLRRLYKKPYIEVAKLIREKIKHDIGIPVSIGLSSSKTLAKLSTERAKNKNGVYRIGFREISAELKKTSLMDIWGIGANTSAFLHKYNIKTAYEITMLENVKIKRLLGKKGVELKHELLGESVYSVSDRFVNPKSIQKTSSFASFTSNEGYIKKSLYYHTHRACSKLRRLGLKTKIVGVMLRTKDFKVFYEKAVLLEPTDWEFDINKAVNFIFEKIYNSNVIYRSSGIHLEDLKEEKQISLFSSVLDSDKKKNLSKTWDKLENKYGRGVITTG